MWKNEWEPNSPQMAIWRMRISYWIPKATNIHSWNVMLIAFPLQQLLHERSLMLRYTYIACLFFVLYFLMRLLIPTSLKRWRNGFLVDTYCPWWNKTEIQRSVDQMNNYCFALSNGFQLFFALIFISVPLLALIIAWVCALRDVLCVMWKVYVTCVSEEGWRHLITYTTNC